MQLTRQPELEVHSVVALGEFNPMIFHPSWFSQNELLPPEETDEAESPIVTREISTFTVSDIHVQVEQGRFGLTTKNSAKTPLLRDLAIGCFTLLEHTPLNAMGLNLDYDFEMRTIGEWHAVGNRLAPKSAWSNILENPGMRAIVMEGKRTGCSADQIHIRVQPSNRAGQGIYVAVNQHYILHATNRKTVRQRNVEALRILKEDWNSFRHYASEAASSIIAGPIA